MDFNTPILRTNVGGLPQDWIGWEEAILMYAKDLVRWEGSENKLKVTGGRNRDTGLPSHIDIASIIAVDSSVDFRNREDFVPTLNNNALFKRDNYTCLYCGGSFDKRMLTRDHVVATSLGGPNTWDNVVTSCKKCNYQKGNLTVKEAEKVGLKLLAIPYTPNNAEHLILSNRRILGDQMNFLSKYVPKTSRIFTFN